MYNFPGVINWSTSAWTGANAAAFSGANKDLGRQSGSFTGFDGTHTISISTIDHDRPGATKNFVLNVSGVEKASAQAKSGIQRRYQGKGRITNSNPTTTTQPPAGTTTTTTAPPPTTTTTIPTGLTVSDVSVKEGSAASLTVTLLGKTGKVEFGTRPGTARATKDYNPTPDPSSYRFRNAGDSTTVNVSALTDLIKSMRG